MGSSKSSHPNYKYVEGKHGTFKVGRYIDKGGNGKVYEATCKSGDDCIPSCEEYVIKILRTELWKSQREKEKRINRFLREIREVTSLQDSIRGIIPVYDHFKEEDYNPDLLWYIMPKASSYDINGKTIQEKLADMLNLAKTIQQLHSREIVHRDIKPQNILVHKNWVCLSDFGLVFNQTIDPHITGAAERIGPYDIRPPEMGMSEKLVGYDYKCADVYLFAKTIWMILKSSDRGFSYEYKRNLKGVAFNRDDFNIESLEPLHRLMEGATLSEWGKRISIDDCVDYLEQQLAVCTHNISEEQIRKMKYEERFAEIDNTVGKSETVYKEKEDVFEVLRLLAGVADVQFYEAGKCCAILRLEENVVLQGDSCTVDLSGYVTSLGFVKKRMEFAVADIRVETKSKKYTISLKNDLRGYMNRIYYTNIMDALRADTYKVSYAGKASIVIEN